MPQDRATRMSSVTLAAVGLAAVGLAAVLSFPLSLRAQAAGAPKLSPNLVAVKAALDKYKDPILAVHDGYFSSVGCIEYSKGMSGHGNMDYKAGGMGVHFLNGALIGRPNAGVDMTFDFPTLIAHVAKTRVLAAGSIVGSGTVSNKEGGGPGRPAAAGGAGYSCLAEQRVVETILEGKAKTPFMRFGDRVRIEMFDSAGRTIFGAIDQIVRKSD